MLPDEYRLNLNKNTINRVFYEISLLFNNVIYLTY